MKNSVYNDYFIAVITLISGLSISAVAVYYSVIGLISIFAAAAGPIMIMGIVLESSKLVATVWLKRHWNDASVLMLSYLTFSVLILMFITSMGIFGFLSKAHSDQSVPSGDIIDKVSLIDEKIKTYKDNIDTARKALLQLDAAVDQTMSRTTSEQGATHSVQIRRTQLKERNQLQQEIAQSQTEIAKLRDERAPIANELRRVEAEVGPIKYIAAMIYGDVLDSNVLERAVRWMIILIVSVFDPMAIMLLLACQHSFKEINKTKENTLIENIYDNDKFTIDEAHKAFSEEISNKNDTIVKETMINNFSGVVFPENPEIGIKFTRTDMDPPRDFIFNGSQWISNDI